VLLLAAATATTGVGKPHVGLKKLLRPHAVQHGAPPPGGMISPAMMGGGMDGGAGAGGAGGRRFPNVRSQVFFVEPADMQIGWQTTAGGAERVYLPAQLSVPARYNFLQGYIYRLKISNITGRPNLTLYPSIEIAPSTLATDAYLTHNPIPCVFTEEDFDQVTAGNFVTKVIYLPDPKYQELAISGVETLVSTRLEPGVDPILEADRRGTILMIIRVGAIDLEMPTGGVSGMVPGILPAETIPSVPVDTTAPVTTPAPPAPAGEVPAQPPAPEPAPAPAPADAPAPATPPTEPGATPPGY
jgi:hypothetical protein